MDAFVDAGPGGEAGEELADVARVQGAARQGAEQLASNADPQTLAGVGPPLDHSQRLGVKAEVRAWSPLPCSTRMVPRRLSTSLG